MKIQIESSDLLKIRDALRNAYDFFQLRDRMNAQVHLAQNVHFSPLTSIVGAEWNRCVEILEEEMKTFED